MRIIICGSRTFTDEALMAISLQRILDKLGPFTLVHGAARGADTLAAGIAHTLGLATEEHPAEWNRYGKRAGYVRNQAMLDSGADYVFAFKDKPVSVGTDMMTSIARKAGVPCREVRSDV